MMERVTLSSAVSILPFWMSLVVLAFPGGAPGEEPPADQPQLCINEVMAANATCLADPQGQFDDWIEIYNAGDTPVDMAGMWLSDDAAEPTRWSFPSDVPFVIASRGYVVVWADGDVGDPGLHASFKLSASGEEVFLFAADGQTLIDSLAFGPQTGDISFGRYPDANDTPRFLSKPTPGGANKGSYLGEVAPLRFSRERGFYNAPFDLTITTDTPDAQILYTTDGRAPDDVTYRLLPGRTYTAPIRVSRTISIRAIAVKPGWKSTRIDTHTYTFDTRSQVTSLPMISLVGDAAKTFFEPDGVMAIVGGSYSGGVWASTGASSYNNILNRGLERPVSAEWILPDNSEGWQMNCGLRVHGSDWIRPRYVRQSGFWSGNGKISLRLYFRSQYDQSRLEYPLFPLSNAEEFATLVLRAGHNDQVNPFIKDELLRRLHRDMGQVSCAGVFANLFINDEYKGYYNPTEQVKEESCQQWFDSDKPWDVVAMFNNVRDGDAQSWNAMMSYARTHNMADPVFYAEMCRKLDVVCFIDYLIIRLWPNDWDWPQNNWSAACERSATGRWKFFVWDAEGTFESNQLQLDRFGELNSQGNENAVLYRALKASPSFRMLFADRLYKHFYNNGALTAGNIQRRFDEMRTVLKGVIPNMSTYLLDTWVPQRLPIFINACTREGVYTFDGPVFTVNQVPQRGGHILATDSLEIVPTRSGTVYYTLDDMDPSQTTAPLPADTTLIAADAPKRVLVPLRVAVGDWCGAGLFDDSTWIQSSGAPGGVGYERSTGYESYITTDVGAQMYTICSSCYIRIPFILTQDKSQLQIMTLRMQYDDGFVAYLNGMEVARRNFTGDPTWSSAATSDHADSEAVNSEAIDISQHIDLLEPGANMLAIQGLNVSASSSDFLITAELVVRVAAASDSPTASTVFTSPIHLDRSTRVKARVKSGTIWSALAEATFAVGPVAESLRISEIMYNPVDPNAEYVELMNIGDEPIDLSLVRFADGIGFEFPAFVLDGGGRCVVVQDTVAFEAKYGTGLLCAGQYQGSLNNAGERIELQDAAGLCIQAFTYSDDWHGITDGGGYSLTVTNPAMADPNALGDAGAWRPSAEAGGSPGADDGVSVTAPEGVLINELLANPGGGESDWIELYNVTDQAVDVSGWYVTDDSDIPMKYEIAADTVLEPYGYLVLTEDDHFGNAADPGCHVPFGLSQNGETLCLCSAWQGVLTGYNERVEFDASEPGVTLGRWPLSTGAWDFARLAEPTPGGPNAGPRVGPVVISEIMYRPDALPNAEFIELLNIGDANVTLYDEAAGSPWRLTTGADGSGVDVLFPGDPPITLAPGEYLLLVADRMMCQVRYALPEGYPAVEWGTRRLNDTGDTVTLSQPGQVDDRDGRHWISMDRVTFSDNAHPESFPGGVDPWPKAANGWGYSLTRVLLDHYGNDPNSWQAAFPSPGAAKRRSDR
ncbi:MAG: lamin tail domain-containing protein [Sedimentisphaerales bacterium]|nr:lamin tail domain-containing protein [Sedimentisphaerales bacterium]